MSSLGKFRGTARIPEARLFSITGSVPKLGESFHYIYAEWLPASGFEMAYPWDLEVYGEQFKGGTPNSLTGIDLPVKEKSP